MRAGNDLGYVPDRSRALFGDARISAVERNLEDGRFGCLADISVSEVDAEEIAVALRIYGSPVWRALNASPWGWAVDAPALHGASAYTSASADLVVAEASADEIDCCRLAFASFPGHEQMFVYHSDADPHGNRRLANPGGLS